MKRIYLCSLFLTLFVLANGTLVFGHGGEDHSGDKAKTASTQTGSVIHTARLGAFEVMFKHPPIEPDTATSARFFATKFETNEAGEDVNPAIEFEAANGAVTEAVVEKNVAGSFIVKIPALPEGVYTVRAKLTYGGETDTATFSGVEIKTPAAAGESGISWARSLSITAVFVVVLAMFAALVYFVWRFAGAAETAESGAMKKETAAA